MVSPRFLFIAATCLGLSCHAGNGPTYRGVYDCNFATVRFEIVHTNMAVDFSFHLKWPNGTEEIVTDREDEVGPGNTIHAFYWTAREMTFRTYIDEGGVPDEITAFILEKTKTCKLTKLETIND